VKARDIRGYQLTDPEGKEEKAGKTPSKKAERKREAVKDSGF